MPQTGERDGYRVVEWSTPWDPSLADLLAAAPELVLGRRVAIVSCDSGPYPPTAPELAAGWRVCDDIALSPPVSDPGSLPTPGFDEWHVFDAPPETLPVRHHVNRFGFSVLAGDGDAAAFWEQVRRCGPRHVLGAGTPRMFLVTRDERLFERLKDRQDA